VLSIVALWRSGRVRVLDMRMSLRKELVELRHALDELKSHIPAAVESRLRVSAAAGAMGGAVEEFDREATNDTATVTELQACLTTIEPIPWLAGYSTLEAKALDAYKVRIAVERLATKYQAAAEADTEVRKHLRDAMIARGNRPK
jgi:hypothetical protein